MIGKRFNHRFAQRLPGATLQARHEGVDQNRKRSRNQTLRSVQVSHHGLYRTPVRQPKRAHQLDPRNQLSQSGQVLGRFVSVQLQVGQTHQAGYFSHVAGVPINEKPHPAHLRGVAG